MGEGLGFDEVIQTVRQMLYSEIKYVFDVFKVLLCHYFNALFHHKQVFVCQSVAVLYCIYYCYGR